MLPDLNPNTQFVRAAVLIIAVFWTIHGLYMVIEPMPVPPRLAWIQGPIVAFPATLILLTPWHCCQRGWLTIARWLRTPWRDTQLS